MSARDFDAALHPCLQSLAQRLWQAGEHVHPAWGWQGSPYEQAMSLLPGHGLQSESVVTAVFERVCGPMPVLTDLMSVAGRWSLMPNHALHPRLAALALYRRPGVLRSCVNARARAELKAFLGSAFDHLSAFAGRGRPMPSDMAHLPPLHWCCVGYLDVCRHGAWPSHSMRRLVRLGLPPGRAILLARSSRGPLGPTFREELALIESWFTPSDAPTQDEHAL